MAGLILWRVKGTWANKGRLGEIDSVVEAGNAIEAAMIAWQVEDPNDLRTLSVEWLCPVQCVSRAFSCAVLTPESITNQMNAEIAAEKAEGDR